MLHLRLMLLLLEAQYFLEMNLQEEWWELRGTALLSQNWFFVIALSLDGLSSEKKQDAEWQVLCRRAILPPIILSAVGNSFGSTSCLWAHTINFWNYDISSYSFIFCLKHLEISKTAVVLHPIQMYPTLKRYASHFFSWRFCIYIFFLYLFHRKDAQSGMCAWKVIWGEHPKIYSA